MRFTSKFCFLRFQGIFTKYFQNLLNKMSFLNGINKNWELLKYNICILDRIDDNIIVQNSQIKIAKVDGTPTSIQNS